MANINIATLDVSLHFILDWIGRAPWLDCHAICIRSELVLDRSFKHRFEAGAHQPPCDVTPQASNFRLITTVCAAHIFRFQQGVA